MNGYLVDDEIGGDLMKLVFHRDEFESENRRRRGRHADGGGGGGGGGGEGMSVEKDAVLHQISGDGGDVIAFRRRRSRIDFQMFRVGDDLNGRDDASRRFGVESGVTSGPG